MSDADRRIDARRWLAFAQDDFRAAEAGGDILVPRQRCFHAQQAAEKALKGALTLAGIDFPRRHDLELLRHLLPDEWSARITPSSLAWLTTWALDQRYPGQMPDATDNDVDRALRDARALLGAIDRDFAAHSAAD